MACELTLRSRGALGVTVREFLPMLIRPIQDSHPWRWRSRGQSRCLSRKPEALHKFDFFRVPLHAGAADSSSFRHVMVRRFLIMLPVISALLACVAGLFRSRASLCLEHLALRHQLAIYKQTVHRPQLHATDRLFWA